MTSLNTALNYSFASSEATRLAFAERGADDAVAAQLRQSSTESLQVGTTITARYQYRVGEGGALIPVGSQVTQEAPEESRDSTSGRKGSRYPNFADLNRPKANLLPSDELSLFAEADDAVQAGDNASLSRNSAEAYDGSGAKLEAVLLAPEVSQNAALSRFTAQAQMAVASLYARNNDVVYNVTPIAQYAA